MDNFRAYLTKYKRCFNISGIECELGLPQKSLRNFVDGKHGFLQSDRSPDKIEEVLRFFQSMGYDPDRHYDIIL